jgi:hypothetical protein
MHSCDSKKGTEITNGGQVLVAGATNQLDPGSIRQSQLTGIRSLKSRLTVRFSCSKAPSWVASEGFERHPFLQPLLNGALGGKGHTRPTIRSEITPVLQEAIEQQA